MPIIELLAQERNLKRRRAKHRGVHTNKKSQTEILREVIVQQMEMYKEYLSEKLGIPIADLNDENNLNPQCIDNIKRENSVDEVYQYHDYKNTSERNSKYYDKDYYSTSRKNTNHHNFNNESISKNQNSWDSYKNNYDKNEDKYESRKCDKNGHSEKNIVIVTIIIENMVSVALEIEKKMIIVVLVIRNEMTTNLVIENVIIVILAMENGIIISLVIKNVTIVILAKKSAMTVIFPKGNEKKMLSVIPTLSMTTHTIINII